MKVSNGEALAPTEEFAYFLVTNSFFRYWENVSYQYRNGLYDDSEYATQREVWGSLLTVDKIRDLWCEGRTGRSEPFVAEIDELLDNPCQ